MTCARDRRHILSLVDEAMEKGASETACADVVNLSQRCLRRWRASLEDPARKGEDRRPHAPRPKPVNALSKQEKDQIVAVANSPEFAPLPPSQIVPALADRGTYLASESTMYRVLRERGLNRRRGRARAPKPSGPKPEHVATRPNSVWVWDVTWLPTLVAGLFLKAYLILDLYSRKIIAWEVWEEENAEHSRDILHRAWLAENIAAEARPLVLHGDNGSPFKAMTVQALMHELGVTPSRSRPRVSNDNAFAESMFRTVKYHPTLPETGFGDLAAARKWFASFCDWYNHCHRHSGLRFVTPDEKHRNLDVGILAGRDSLYREARTKNPGRWIGGGTRNWKPVEQTSLTPSDNRHMERTLKQSA